MKNVIPVVMAGGTCEAMMWDGMRYAERCVLHSLRVVIGIYGLIVGVILAQSIQIPSGNRENVYSIYSATAHVSLAKILLKKS